MRKEEVLDCTPRYVFKLFEWKEQRRKQERHHRDFMLAQLIAKMHNVHVRKAEHLVAPKDFMPSYGSGSGEVPKAKDKYQIADEFRSILRAVTRSG